MKKIALVFPGQGSQYQGMGQDLYNNNKIVREIFEEASDMIGLDMKKLCFETNLSELTQTKNSQPAIFTTSYAAFKVFMKEGLEPSFMAGHSLGEITALTCSGAVSFSDAIQLIRARGLIMQKIAEQSIGSMIAVKGSNIDTIDKLCKEYSMNEKIASIANYNSTKQIVISGDKDTVMQVGEAIEKSGGKYTQINVNAPFHSFLMNDAVGEFENELKKYTYNDIKFPVVSNVTAKPYNNSNEIIKILSKHLVSPVLWKNTVDYFDENGVKFVIELGPKYVLRNLIRNSTSQISAFSYDDSNDISNLIDVVEEYTGKPSAIFEKQNKLRNLLKDCIDRITDLYLNKQKSSSNNLREGDNYNKKMTVVTLCLANAISVPNKNFNEQEYETGVLEPYKKIRKMQAVIERENREPNKDEIEEALKMLFSVFNTKNVLIDEQELRFKKIYDRLSQLN